MDFTKVQEYLDVIVKDYHIPSCQCAVAKDGKLVWFGQSGTRDYAQTEPVRDDDLYWLYSSTKVTTMVAVAQLIEQGKLTLATPLGDILPEYRTMRIKTETGFRACETPITIGQMMSMAAGFSYEQSPCLSYAAAHPDAGTVEILRDYADLPLNYEPGKRFVYSMAHDILGAVVEVVSGERFAAYCENHIFKPLGMTDSSFHTDDARLSRVVAQYLYEKYDRQPHNSMAHTHTNKHIFTDRYDSGGAGISSNAKDYVLLVGALANGGVGNGNRILKPETIDLLRASELTPEGRADFARWYNRPGYCYAHGVRVLVNPENAEASSPAGEFGWDGAAGAIALASPETGIALCFTMHVLGCGVAYLVIHRELRNLVFEAFR